MIRTIVTTRYRDPLAAAGALRDEPMTLLLRGCGDHPLSRFSFVMSDPVETFIAAPGEGADAFARARAWVEAHRVEDALPAPFCGGVAGLIGYESARLFDAAPCLAPDDGAPGIALGAYDRVAVFDHVKQRAYVVAWEMGSRPAQERATDLACRLSEGEQAAAMLKAAGRIEAAAPVAAYEATVRAVVARVRAGDIYQANVSRRYEGALGAGDHPYDLFRRLCDESPAPYCAYLRLDDGALISNSPERFLAAAPSGDGLMASTHPIKGTRPRGITPAEDAARVRELSESEKDRAENLMIVDLMRNDLAKVCAPGSVRVPRLFGVESFANVHHLVSDVVGRVKPEKTAFDLFAAAFPPGSITGAPKIKAMEIIAAQERVGRGAYCGSLAWFGFDGAMDASVLIRTAMCRPQGVGWGVSFNVGAGIVADSDPAEEARETMDKAAALVRAIEGAKDVSLAK
jgi:para-aminobenzoate synthetase component 1